MNPHDYLRSIPAAELHLGHMRNAISMPGGAWACDAYAKTHNGRLWACFLSEAGWQGVLAEWRIKDVARYLSSVPLRELFA